MTRSAQHSSLTAPEARALESVGLQIEIGPLLVRVRSDMPLVAKHLEAMYPDFPKRAGDESHVDVAVVFSRGARRWLRPQATLSVNGARPFLPLPVSLAGPLFEWGLNWSIGRCAHRWVVVHAAVLERGGRAMILPAPPGSGKSTLCAALAFSGWRLFSDEFAVLDADTGRISPIPRPISLKAASIPLIRRRHAEAVMSAERRDVEGASFVHVRPPVDSVRRAREDALPGWVVLPRYVPGRATALERLPKAQALMRIADQSFNYNYLGARGFGCLAELVRRAECYTFEYSDLDDGLAALADMTAV